MSDEEAALCYRKIRRMNHPNKHMIRFAFRSVSFVALLLLFAFISLSQSTTNNEPADQFHRHLANATETECDEKPTVSSGVLQTVGLIAGVLYMFLGLAVVCDEFFVPALEEMSGPDHLNLSMDIAGATLMAAGGSAPELFTAFFGTFKKSDMGFGTIVGSAVFNVLFVIAMCSLFSKEVLSLTWWPLFRDSAYYVAGLVLVGVFVGVTSPGKIEWWEALVLFLGYLGYIAVMAFNKKLQAVFTGKKKEEDDEEPEKIYMDDENNVEYDADKSKGRQSGQAGVGANASLIVAESSVETQHIDFRFPSNFRCGVVNLITTPQRFSDTAAVNLVGKVKGDVNEVFKHVDKDGSQDVSREELKEVLIELRLPLDNDEVDQLFKDLDVDNDGKIDKHEFTIWYLGSQDRMMLNVKEIFEELDANNSNTLDRDEIKELLLKVSSHVSEDDITDSLAEMYKTGDKDEITFSEFEEWYKDSLVLQKQQEAEADVAEGMCARLKPPKGAGPLGLLSYIVLLPLVLTLTLTIPDVRRLGKEKWCYLSFLLSIGWIGGFSFLMVGWATLLGATFGIPDLIMGLTVLAAGTSVPDLLSSVIVARMGHGDMAVSSSIGSNIFDILVGLPLPWFAFNIIMQEEVIIGAEGIVIDIGILVVMILVIILTIHLNGWKLTKIAGWMMIVFYLAFLAQAIVRQLDQFGLSC